MKRIPIANLSDIDSVENAFVFSFGAYGETSVLVLANSLEDGLEIAAEWLLENHPDVFSAPDYDDSAKELFGKSVDDDLSEEEWEKVREHAETDHTYTESGWLLSHEWGVWEPDFDKVKAALTTIDTETL